MTTYDVAILSRDVDAFLVPSGARIYLPQGTEVTITQNVGNGFTVNIYGNLARIDNKDADALGKEVIQTKLEADENTSLEDLVWSQLKTCYDPEIPVNIVDLGLIYKCEIKELPEQLHQVDVKMTLTAPGCGMGPVLANDVKQKISAIAQIKEVNVELVFDPPWDRSMMSDAAKLELGIF